MPLLIAMAIAGAALGIALVVADVLNQRDVRRGIFHYASAPGHTPVKGKSHERQGKNGSAASGILPAKVTEGERITMEAISRLRDAQERITAGDHPAALSLLEDALTFARHQKFGLTPPKDQMFRIQIAVAIDACRRKVYEQQGA